MPDRVFYPVLGLLAAGVVALGLVWPQGMGGPSPRPFGHGLEPIAQPIMTPEKLKAEADALKARVSQYEKPAPAANSARRP